ncbi:RING-H2 finger protein ATL5B [Rhynchospora pubera]|uniref:RING-H2 finger protein ATL5B n=1 Tax=Rhynchospora pubera TaxID=906938 RepID=A0AAV8G749_9POAL|nr:RING-H2 finger protein ATL5B [Rhynchospora pubera]
MGHRSTLNCQNNNCSLPQNTNSTNPGPAQAAIATSSPLDYDVVVILAAMICALVCALGLNTMLQCIVRCTRRALSEPAAWAANRRAHAGLKHEDLVALPVAVVGPTCVASGCAICLSDFIDGERIRVLPACGHRFHVSCIDTWLRSHCSCPTCRRHLLTEGSGTSSIAEP